MGEPLVEVQGLSKKLCRNLRHSIGHAMADIASDLLFLRRDRSRLRRSEFWALRDIDLRLERGEALGLIGANGAGKTTLLRVIGGLLKPDAGQVTIRGTLAPLLAMGAGFSPLLSGRENIRINLALLGMDAARIRQSESEVVAFAELAHAIDAPLHTYSSGMVARLGFSCAVHTTPDVLLVDEVLAVGDLRFRLKCYRKLGELQNKGTALILVSHQPQLLLSVCRSALYLAGGRRMAYGPCSQIMREYENVELAIGEAGASDVQLAWEWPQRPGHGATFTALRFCDSGGGALERLESGRVCQLELDVHAQTELADVCLSVVVLDASLDNERVLNLRSEEDAVRFQLRPGHNRLTLRLDPLGLRPGTYALKIGLHRGTFDQFDVLENLRFAVFSHQTSADALFFQPRQWI